MNLLAIIPARGGSKGIPGKNIKVLAGKPLLAWTVEIALQSKDIDRVIVSTDDKKIALVAEKCGAEVPFIRPKTLSRDDTPGIAPVLHAIEQLPDFDWILLLQPTSPFRSVDDINGIIECCRDERVSSIVSVSEANKHPFWMYSLSEDNLLRPLLPNRQETSRRQELPTVYALNGAMYLARTDWLMQNKTFVNSETRGYVMPVERSVDLDSPIDWQWAEYLIEHKLVE